MRVIITAILCCFLSSVSGYAVCALGHRHMTSLSPAVFMMAKKKGKAKGEGAGATVQVVLSSAIKGVGKPGDLVKVKCGRGFRT